MMSGDELLKSLGVDNTAAAGVVASWQDRENDRARVSSMCQLIKQDEYLWPTAVTIDDRLAKGIYSPLQLLLSECLSKTKDQTDLDYPFLFSLIGLMCSTLLGQLGTDQPIETWPLDSAHSRRLLQSVFQLREITEERERLSIEVILPEEEGSKTLLKVERLARIFGRGVAEAQGKELEDHPGGSGKIARIFPDHASAPSSRLYRLEATFDHLKQHQLSFCVRRDGHVTIAAQENPLLEFYDGGWHIVDLKSGRGALTRLLERSFPGSPPNDDLRDSILNLAYHMATHWHSGILAVIEDKQLDNDPARILEPQSEDSKKVTEVITENLVSKPNILTMSQVVTEGLGRVLLTNAIQDGATIFTPDGRFHSAGRMVSIPKQVSVGGAGTRAATGLAPYGVAVKISKDGAIRIFAAKEGIALVPPEGLRIH